MKQAFFIALLFCFAAPFSGRATVYYVDPTKGDDQHSGRKPGKAWKTLVRVEQAELHAGDVVRFKKGSCFTGPLVIRYSGTSNKPIVITDYGKQKDAPPTFTNSIFREGNFANCIRIEGSYVVVENIKCEKTAAYQPIQYIGEGWDVWEMGAIHIAKGAEYCIVRNNEIIDCVAGIRSNGRHTLIVNNYIHDCNRVLKEWNWGPIGIWLGADHQEVAYNKIINYSAVDPRIGWGPDSYGSGADGGAIEIDDARNDKYNISIHHNYSRDCQGFLEVTWTDVKQKPDYRNFSIHHNISDDYQQFIALWRGADCRIENNTIIRRKKNANDWGVFNITQQNAHNFIRNNIIVVEKGIIVFNVGRKGTAKPEDQISNNLFYAAEGALNIGKEGPGTNAIIENPLFKNYKNGLRPEDFRLLKRSAAIDKGVLLDYAIDFANGSIPQNSKADIGAYEYSLPGKRNNKKTFH